MSELLHLGQIVTSVFVLVGALLLGYMKKAGAERTHDPFSRNYLRKGSWAMALIAIEVVFAEYRIVRLPLEMLPTDAVAAGFIGRLIEAAGLWIVVGYLVRGNGKSTSAQ